MMNTVSQKSIHDEDKLLREEKTTRSKAKNVKFKNIWPVRGLLATATLSKAGQLQKQDELTQLARGKVSMESMMTCPIVALA